MANLGEENRELSLKLERERSKTTKLYCFVRDLLSTAQDAVDVIRAILYAGSVFGAWFYLKDHALAVAVACALTSAHVLMELKAFLERKEKQLYEENR